MARLDDANLNFDVADTRHRFTFMTMGEYNPAYSATLDGYLDAAPSHKVADEAIKWVLSRLWRDCVKPPS